MTRVACVQLQARPAVSDNVETATRLVAEAAGRGAELIVLPEKWPVFGGRDELWPAAEPVDGPLMREVGGWARTLGVAIVAGSFSEQIDGDERVHNTSVVFDRDGQCIAVYRKLHLFDVDVGGRRVRESDSDAPGERPVMTDVAGLSVGLAVCYDLRFPELFRLYAQGGADLVTLPSAFAERTGRDHWEVLVRARAIENLIYVAAADQWGRLATGHVAFGRSMIVDPWGTVLAQAPDGEGVIVADCERATLDRVRRELPTLAHVRPDVYRAPEHIAR